MSDVPPTVVSLGYGVGVVALLVAAAGTALALGLRLAHRWWGGLDDTRRQAIALAIVETHAGAMFPDLGRDDAHEG